VPSSRNVVYEYHDGTKHHFHRFARSLGYLDWASQPRPFRTFEGTNARNLYPASGSTDVGYRPAPILYDELFAAEPSPLSASFPAAAHVSRQLGAALGDLLRHSLGLSAWKRHGAARWSLRVNPSSGNLHPTEAYIVCGPVAGLASSAALYHYAADRHALEERCRFDTVAWTEACEGRDDIVVIALTSIHWREAWKYGERAFRYCQHDLGHAIAAVRLAATLVGWRAELLPRWSHDAIAALTGIDRQVDFLEAEPEEPGCLLALSHLPVPARLEAPDEQLLGVMKRGSWSGRASQLSEDHVEWSFLEDVARSTRDPGRLAPVRANHGDTRRRPQPDAGSRPPAAQSARALILQRRSALRFDGRTSIDHERFFAMLARTCPGERARSPWDALWWSPAVHLVLFVHRVEQVSPGLYVLVRSSTESSAIVSEAALRAAMRAEFLWEPVGSHPRLLCLARGDCRGLARRLSCDQDIASDGFFSVAMLAAFEQAIETHGPSFYRHLFWETGVIGQVLYLEAEAAAARATGIGCFYDDPVHEVLGLSDHTFQSLYHFTVGTPVEDPRLTSERGYEWEGAS
jgi:SagB-type dehydrogenase family enzyme